jgi:hypothetical protein
LGEGEFFQRNPPIEYPDWCLSRVDENQKVKKEKEVLLSGVLESQASEMRSSCVMVVMVASLGGVVDASVILR